MQEVEGVINGTFNYYDLKVKYFGFTFIEIF